MNNPAELTPELVAEIRADIDADPQVRLSTNAVTAGGIGAASLDRQKAVTPTSMSTKLDKWKVANQKKSGRCWLFAALNIMRAGVMEKLGTDDFELSQNYALFWDKLERANYFLEDQLQLAGDGEDLDSRLSQFLLADVLGDGGQWDMLVGVFQKHGVVPQEVMPETVASSNTEPMNAQLRLLLRRTALEMRELETQEERRALKNRVLKDIYRILVINLGIPPTSFDWQWRDKDGMFHRDGEMTPTEFMDKYVDLDLEDYVCLVDDPRTAHPKNAPLTVSHLGNVVGGPEVKYLNVDVETMKALAAKSLNEGHPVWFGCDVGQHSDRKAGLLVKDIYDYPGVLGVDLSTTKEQRVLTGESMMTHAMVLTGVDEVKGEPRRWRVENSWGDEIGDKGYFTMDDDWFTDFVFEVVVKKSDLSSEQQAALDEEPLVLPAWDPMGALARPVRAGA